jgi:hypothetical protein
MDTAAMPLRVSCTLSDGTLGHMKEVRCERCDNIIGMGCACPPDGSVPKAILIKQNGKAHVPGACDHMTEDEVRPPKWGWILDPSPGDWGRISESSPAIATEGNAQLRATSRCMTCMGTLGG